MIQAISSAAIFGAILTFSALSHSGIDEDEYCFEDEGCWSSTVNNYIEPEIKGQEKFVAGFTGKKINHTTSRAVDGSVDESLDDANVFHMKSGENLKKVLERWVGQAGYRNLIWDVRNAEGDELRIPIRSTAALRCDFKECLRQIKKAYATAKPKPMYLDFDVKDGNKVVYVQQLHLGR